jgi:hypothetical protein
MLRLIPLTAILLAAFASGGPAGERSAAPYDQNPRYLSLGGVPVFALGATHHHSWTPISRPGVDVLRDINRLAEVVSRIGSPHVVGFVRCLPYDPMNHLHDGEVDRVLQPWVKLADGRFDLDRFEPEWERRLGLFLDAARERDILVSLEVWDDWSVTRGPGGHYDPGGAYGWNGHPFHPDNNVNYGHDALSPATRACVAPFYETIPSRENREPVLRLQRRYVDRLVAVAGGYANVLWNISNETRATLEWSRYWAEYLRERLPKGRMIGEMPSTNRRDGGGECDDSLSPLSLASDDRYDFVDIAQGVSAHEFGADPARQGLGGFERVLAYQSAMASSGRTKPLLVSKDYHRRSDGGTAVLWSRFVGGSAAARFHRPAGDDPPAVSDFQYEAIERLGRFLAGTEFWRMEPQPDLVAWLPEGGPGAGSLGWTGREYVVQLFDGQGGDLALRLARGRWRIWIYEPTADAWVGPGAESGRAVVARDAPVFLSVPAYDETLIVHARRLGRR